jgi:uncharacterized protein YhfF
MGDSILNANSERLWRQYLEAAPDADNAQRWFYEAFRIGSSAESADDGALLVLRGIKTAASSLLWVAQCPTQTPATGRLSEHPRERS